MPTSSGNAAGPTGISPPGRRRRVQPVVVLGAIAVLSIAVTGATTAPTATEAMFTSQATTQVNTITAGPLTCDRTVDEPLLERTATCTLVVTNDGPATVDLTADVTAKSTSTNDQPILFYGGPPTLDPPPHTPHYQENVYISDSLTGGSLGLGNLSCTTGDRTPGTCDSSDTGQPVASLVPGESDTFTVTVELDKGDDNSGTLVVTLTAHAGQLSPTLVDATDLS